MVEIGDIVYISSSFYLSHGIDDFVGGKATVDGVYEEMSGGEITTFITVEENARTSYNWGQLLSKEQKALAERFGNNWAHPQPDHRPEFNRRD